MALLKDPLQRVATGFGFLFAAALLPTVFLAFLVIAFVVLAATEAFNGMWTEQEILVAGLTVLIAMPITSYLLGVIGFFLCLATPSQARTGEIILVVVGLEILIILLAASRYLVYWWPALASWLGTIDLVTVMLFFIEKALFVWFVSWLAHYLGRRDLARMILSAAVRFVVALVIAAGAYALFVSTDRLKVGGGLVIATFIAFLLVGIAVLLVAYVGYLRCLLRLRRAIQQPA
jgi:hypothetical protein